MKHIMKKFFGDWLFSAFVGAVFGVIAFVFWMFLARTSAEVTTVFFAVVLAVAFVMLAIYAIKHYGGGTLFLGALLATGIFYITGAAFGLDWLTVIGLPAGMESAKMAWILHIFFGGAYWVILSLLLVAVLIVVDSKNKMLELCYMLTIMAAAVGVMYLGNCLFPII